MKKNSAIDRRLRELQKEIRALDRDVKTLSKAVKTEDIETVEYKLRTLAAAQPLSTGSDARRDVASLTSAGSDSETSLPAVFSGVANADDVGAPPAGAGGSFGVPLQTRAQDRSGRDRDERFANYFVSGNVESVRPLRQERSVQRNKAILMVVIVVLVLLGVLYLAL